MGAYGPHEQKLPAYGYLLLIRSRPSLSVIWVMLPGIREYLCMSSASLTAARSGISQPLPPSTCIGETAPSCFPAFPHTPLAVKTDVTVHDTMRCSAGGTEACISGTNDNCLPPDSSLGIGNPPSPEGGVAALCTFYRHGVGMCGARQIEPMGFQMRF